MRMPIRPRHPNAIPNVNLGEPESRTIRRTATHIMGAETGLYRPMPIRMPDPEAIRREIAQAASEAGGASIDHYLTLLGPVELTSSADEGSWRLSYYLGSLAEIEAIESAVAAVHRNYPLVRAG